MKVIPLRHSNRTINPNLVAYFTNDQLAEQDFKKKRKDTFAKHISASVCMKENETDDF